MTARLGPAARLLLLSLLAALALPGSPRAAFRAEADNDYFNFWHSQRERPDREYTQGLRLHLDALEPPTWFPRFARAGAPCVLAGFELGQEIYTPTRDSPEPVPGERAYAAWLYLGASSHRLDAARRRTVSLRVGVTGDPALGEAAQVALHRLRGFRRPLGWDHQIGFEPAVAVSYEERRTFAAWEPRGPRLLELAASGRASAGNWLTGAAAGIEIRAGWNIPRLSDAVRGHATGRLSAWVAGSARQDWIVRSLPLDGGMFHDGPDVDRRALVPQTEMGGGVRWGAVALEYRVVTRGREYSTGPRAHHWGALRLAVGRPAPGGL